MSRGPLRVALLAATLLLAATTTVHAQLDLAARVPSAARQPRLAQFVRELESTDWVAEDPELAKWRTGPGEALPLMERVARLDAMVVGRQRKALNQLAASNLPEAEKLALLETLLDHPAPEVASFAGSLAVRRGDFALAESIASRMDAWAPAQRGQLFVTLGSDRLHTRWLPLARSAMLGAMWIASADSEAAEEDRSVFLLAGRAGVILLGSSESEDVQLLFDSLFVFPEHPWLWMAAARFEPTPQLVELARSVYPSAGGKPALQAAVGLVLLDREEGVFETIRGHILHDLRAYGCADCAENAKGGQDQEVAFALFAVLNELPHDRIELLFEDVLPYSYQRSGLLAYGVLAERMPDELMRAVLERDDLGDGAYPALYEVGARHPEWMASARSLIPEADLELLDRRARATGADRLVPRHGLRPWKAPE